MKIIENIYIAKTLSIIFTAVLGYVIYKLLVSFLKKIFRVRGKNVDESKKKMIANLLNNFVKYFIIVIFLLMVLESLGIDTKALITSLGVVGLVAGLAVQDTIKDFVAGITIMVEDQYRIGDNVKINDFRGEVIALGIKTTRVKAYTGEVLIIPNHLIESVINYSRTNSLAVVDISISYESEVEAAIDVLNKMCIDIVKSVPELLKTPEVLGVQNLGDSSIDIRIIGETEPMKNFGVERELKKQAKLVLDANNITIPYPQVVIHNGKRV